MDVTEHFVPHESETPALSVRKGLLGLLVAKPSAIEFAYLAQRQGRFRPSQRRCFGCRVYGGPRLEEATFACPIF